MIKLKPHKSQSTVLKSEERGLVVCAGRRFGKSKLGKYKLLQMIQEHEIVPNTQYFLVAMPTLYQARLVWWDDLVSTLSKHPFFSHVRKSEYRIVMKPGIPDVILRGVNDHDGDGVRGLEFAGVIIDEFADCSPKAWTESIFPAIKGKFLIIGTPKGQANHFFDVFHSAEDNPEWKSFHFITADNKYYPKNLLDAARLTLSPRAFKQEFEASWESYEGMCFAEYSPATHNVYYDPSLTLETYIGVDWGDRNPAISVCVLRNDYTWFIKDSWTSNGRTTTLATLLRKIEEIVRTHEASRVFMPDDRPGATLEARDFGRERKCDALANAVSVKRNQPGVKESIEIINNLFYKGDLLVNKTQKLLTKQILSYRFDEAGKPIKKDDHIINSFQYVIAPYEYQRFRNSPC